MPGMPVIRGALAKNESLPTLACAGWVNGAPPKFGDEQLKYAIIDVWARWCSEVPKSIPGLKELHNEFGSRGVAFVSLTTEKQDVVEQFVSSNTIPWSSGYQADMQTINALGASNIGLGPPGYDVRPVLYIVDSHGKVVWSDNFKRIEHNDDDKSQLAAMLRAELLKRLMEDEERATDSSSAEK